MKEVKRIVSSEGLMSSTERILRKFSAENLRARRGELFFLPYILVSINRYLDQRFAPVFLTWPFSIKSFSSR